MARRARRGAEPAPEADADGEDGQPRRRRFGGLRRKAASVVGAEAVQSGYDAGRDAFSTAFADEATVGREESFDEAMRRQGLNEADVMAAGTRQQLTAYLYGGMAVLLYLAALVSIVLGLINGGFFSRLTFIFPCIGIGTLMGALSFRACFRLWQIRTWQLGSFEDFLAKRHEWWPRGPVPRPRRRRAHPQIARGQGAQARQISGPRRQIAKGSGSSSPRSG